MNLLVQLENDLVAAQKSGDDLKISTLRFMLSKIHDAQIAKGKDEPLQNSEIQAEILREVKQHKESIESFEKASRTDLVAKEKAELAILEDYLPEQLTEAAITRIIEQTLTQTGAATPADFGRVMGVVMAKIAGRADGTTVSGIVKEKLAQK